MQEVLEYFHFHKRCNHLYKRHFFLFDHLLSIVFPHKVYTNALNCFYFKHFFLCVLMHNFKFPEVFKVQICIWQVCVCKCVFNNYCDFHNVIVFEEVILNSCKDLVHIFVDFFNLLISVFIDFDFLNFFNKSWHLLWI